MHLLYYGYKVDDTSLIVRHIFFSNYNLRKITREVGVIEDISPNEKEVISIINKLKEHYVTPIVMKDIIDDMKYEISPTIITTRT